MLNTIMALWNHNPGESRQRIAKVLFACLFTGVSLSLLLFMFNDSVWPPFVGAENQPTKTQRTPSNSRAIATAGKTSAGDVGTPAVTPTATSSGARIIVPPLCMPTPTVIAHSGAPTGPQEAAVSSGKSDLRKRRSEQRHVHPKTIPLKKDKPSPATRPKKAGPTPVSQPTETVPIVPPVFPIATPTAQPTVTPVAVVTEAPPGTIVSNVPAVITTSATPDMSATPTTQFTSSLQQKEAHKVPVQTLAKSDDRKNGNMGCRRSATMDLHQTSNVARQIQRFASHLDEALFWLL
ncbi:MAG: hypothetical protein JO011_13780 [Ktedonobacteraceae bacterium]|nr:hypothetical protein [Ktedonobacteraceae bacterium]